MKLQNHSYTKHLSDGFRKTTNNRMELLAVIVGLEAIRKKDQNVIIYSDSKYVVNAIEKKWVFKWEVNQFAKKKNSDLWMRFLNVYRNHTVNFFWIKGHNNHPENDLADQLAVKALQKEHLKVDEYYERLKKNKKI